MTTQPPASPLDSAATPTETRLAPVEPSAQPLWMMHVIGPDDLYPAPDFQTAVDWCAYLNREVAPKVPDVWCFAVPAVWAGTAADHAEGLPEAIKGWSRPAALPPREEADNLENPDEPAAPENARNWPREEAPADEAGPAEREIGRAVYERIEKLIKTDPHGAELDYLSHLAESVEEVGGYDGPLSALRAQPQPEQGEASGETREAVARVELVQGRRNLLWLGGYVPDGTPLYLQPSYSYSLKRDADRYRFLRTRAPGPDGELPESGPFIGQVPENFILTEDDADRVVDQFALIRPAPVAGEGKIVGLAANEIGAHIAKRDAEYEAALSDLTITPDASSLDELGRSICGALMDCPAMSIDKQADFVARALWPVIFTPARSEALDEGAAGEIKVTDEMVLAALKARFGHESYALDEFNDPWRAQDNRDHMRRQITAALALYARPSPTPAADDDRLREAQESSDAEWLKDLLLDAMDQAPSECEEHGHNDHDTRIMRILAALKAEVKK